MILIFVVQDHPRLNKLVLVHIRPYRDEEKVSRSESFARVLRHNPKIMDIHCCPGLFDEATLKRVQFKDLLALNQFRPRFATLRADEAAVPALMAHALAVQNSPTLVMALLQACQAACFERARGGDDRKMPPRKPPREEPSTGAQENE